MHLGSVIIDLKDKDLALPLGCISPLLCYRDSTDLSDEAICLGSILELNTSDIVYAGDETEERMQNVY